MTMEDVTQAGMKVGSAFKEWCVVFGIPAEAIKIGKDILAAAYMEGMLEGLRTAKEEGLLKDDSDFNF